MTTATALNFAVLQISNHVQQGTPGDVRIWSQHDTLEQAEAERNRIGENDDESVYAYRVGELVGAVYHEVEY